MKASFSWLNTRKCILLPVAVILGTLFAGEASEAAITFVQQRASNFSARSSGTLAFSTNTTAGNLIIVGLYIGPSASITSVKDSQGNTYQQIGSTVASPSGNESAALFFAGNIRGGSDSITVTTSAVPAYPGFAIYLFEYKGIRTVSPLDGAAQSSGSSSSVSSGTITTTATGDLLFGFCISDSSCSKGSGFTARSTYESNLGEDEIVSAPGPNAATATSTAPWIMHAAAFIGASIDTTAPSVPTGLTASPISISQINLSWNSSSDNVGVAGYRVFRNGSQIAQVTGTSYSNTGLTPATSYSYTVAAYDAAANVSAQSSAVLATTLSDITAPSTPANPALSVISSTQINLSWTASVDNVGVTGYRVFRDGSQIAQVTGTSYSNTGLTPATTYSYTVAAYDAAGNVSAQSSAIVGTTQSVDTTAPSVPTGLTATGVSPSQINLSWTASTDNVGVVGYRVFRDTVQVATSTATSYVNPGLAASTTYTYTVAAFDAAGNVSGQSSPAAATTQALDTTPPTLSLTSPVAGAVSGAVVVSAAASDNVAVTGVQFKLDGANLQAEDTTSPYSISWDTTTSANGPHAITAVARDAAGNTATSVAVPVTVSNTNPNDPSIVGQWTGPYTWPVVAVHMSLLQTGKVLAWDDSAGSAVVWNPATGAFSPVPIADNLFCSGHVETADGKVFVVGGHANFDIGLTSINVFDPTTESWSQKAPMSFARWYGTGTTLGDGRVLATLGTINCKTCIAGTPEVYNPVTNSWTTVAGANLPFTPYYGHMFVLPNGKLFAAAASENNIVSRMLDLQAQTWSTVGATAIDGTASVMYQPGKIMKSGGAWDDNVGTPSDRAYVIDMTQPSPTWRQVASMAFSRVTHNQTLLPDGNVLTTGGSNNSNVALVSASVYDAEMWSPTTETWKTMAKMQVQRVYHSTAILLPDGRVLSAGSGRFPGGLDQTSAEIYSPPYLFKGPRPAIGSAPGTIQYAGSFFVGTPDGPSISSVSLIRLGSVTHAFDENQRFVNLTFQQASGGLTIQAPPDGNYAPPGFYMLFLVNSTRVPSIASFVRLPAPYEDTQPPTAPASLAASGSIGSATLNWTPATDNVGVVLYNVHRSTTSGFVPAPGNRIAQISSTAYTDFVAAGVYNYVVTAQDGVGNVSVPSNQASATVTADTIPPTAPTNLAATPVSYSQIDLTWNVSTDNIALAGYRVFRNGSLIATGTANSYSDKGLTASTTYTYTVSAFDASGNVSPLSQPQNAMTLAGPVLPLGLLAAYTFSEGAGTTTADDSGNGNTGTLTGGPVWSAGKYGSALSYNGTTTYVSVRNTFDITALPFTIAAWVNAANYNDYRKIFSKRDRWAAGAVRVDLTLEIGGGRVVIEQPGMTLTFSYSPPVNAWTHLAVVARTTGTDLYVNGSLTETLGPFTLGTGATAQVRIGRAGDGQDPFLGGIDNLRIYSRALSQTEVQTDMNTPIQ
ncbi:MAG TPA: LamG-like jellyroll fold domain-containing protein [Terriglobia bacterium]|nr:LamG-like jellyroll fold domain-containing protein [Terriglobia bacterium]